MTTSHGSLIRLRLDIDFAGLKIQKGEALA